MSPKYRYKLPEIELQFLDAGRNSPKPHDPPICNVPETMTTGHTLYNPQRTTGMVKGVP